MKKILIVLCLIAFALVSCGSTQNISNEDADNFVCVQVDTYISRCVDNEAQIVCYVLSNNLIGYGGIDCIPKPDIAISSHGIFE